MPSIAPLPASHKGLTPASPPPAERSATGGISRSTRRDGQPSWHVDLHRGGRRLHMHFADHTFGGQAPALLVARAWRDVVLAVVPALGEGGQATRHTRQQATGLPGLYWIKACPNRAASWQARVAPPGERPRTRSFSIGQHGEDRARALAEAWLREQFASLESASIKPFDLPTLPDPLHEPAGTDAAASYGISRVVTARGRALWHVHLIRSALRVQAGFADLTYGGQAPALRVARAWRDAVMAAVPPLTNIEMRQIVRRNRGQGMPGVYFSAARQTWIAIVTLPGRREVKQSFKVSTHGEEQARALAEAERLRMLDALANGRDPALRSPTALAAAKRDFQADPGTPDQGG